MENPYLAMPPQEPLLERAKALLAQNGSLSEAARLIEAAIQKGDLGAGGFEAWILLGETRSMDEREDAAMRALREGVRIAEEAGGKGEGMVVSFVHSSRRGIIDGDCSRLLSHTRTSLMRRLPTTSF